jgi:hypothetical protein
MPSKSSRSSNKRHKIWAWEPLTTKSRKGQRKDGQYQDNQSKTKEKKDTEKTKKDIRKWCNFHKSPWHNSADCRSKKSLVDKVKAFESDVGSESELEPEMGRWIIDAEPSATVATTKLQPGEPDEPEEERLFHSQMWVKGTPLHFIVDRGSQNNTAPTTLHHWMAPPRKRSQRQPTVSIVVRHQALQRRGIV